jgi:2-phospho-L-lactate transferase/gluconeogenesis factor (CofD/UPF0052 family)
VSSRQSPRRERRDLRVVLFSGGRGSGALAALVATDPRVNLTVAINGYDDGRSTGEVRRFLGDALGPSDFRKNASRLATLRRSCAPALIALLDSRLPDRATGEDVRQLIAALEAGNRADVRDIDERPRRDVRSRLRTFDEAYSAFATGRTLNFADASVGNFVFAGSFLQSAHNFNRAVDDYCALLGLPNGLIENVTDGSNAFLVALDDDGRLLGSEEEIVDATRRNRIAEIFLIEKPLEPDERSALGALPPDARRDALQVRSRNHRDIIVR